MDQAMGEIAALESVKADDALAFKEQLSGFTRQILKRTDELQVGVSESNCQAEGLVSDVFRIVTTMQFHDIIRQKDEHGNEYLLKIREHLDALGLNLSGGDLVEETREALRHMERRYTMEFERIVHQQALNGPPAAFGALDEGIPSASPDKMTLF